MIDMKMHLERLRDHAAECAVVSAEAETREKRDLFARLTAHLLRAADDVELVIQSRQPPAP
jgi:hypothetical protein